MNIRFLWIKLNIYSLLLCFLLCAATVIFFSFGVLHDTLWKKILFALPALYILNKALFIMGQYQHKKELMERLFTTCRERGYAPRRFMNYMDTLCMQRVVYLTLVELNMPQEYANLKALKKMPHTGYSRPATAHYEFKDGKMNFILIEPEENGE